MGVSQSLLSHYEKGLRECGLSFLVKAAKYYGVSCDWLLGNSGNVINLNEIDFSDAEQDGEMSVETLARAAAGVAIGSEDDGELMEYMTYIFGLASYFAICGGVKRGVVPKEWLCGEKADRRKLLHLAASASEAYERLEHKEPEVQGEETEASVPLCIRTVNSWIEDCLNISIAGLLQQK